MNKPVFNLEKILDDERKLYEKIYNIEEKKTPAIIERDGKLIELLSVEQEMIVSEISLLEKARNEAVKQYISMNHLNDMGREYTIRDVILSMDEDSSLHLLRIGMDLKDLLLKISEIQKTNERMIKDNMEFFDILLSGLRSSGSINAGYGRNGREDGKVHGAFIFNQTA